jgi:hypothetical protein
MLLRVFRRLPLRILLLALCINPLVCSAKLTTEQKLSDFKQLVAFYKRSYAPLQWKKQVSGFDASDERPWLARVANTTDDLGYVELCAEYVADLNDSHSFYQLQRNEWKAKLPFEVGTYADGAIEKVLIDKIDRTKLPESQYPFQIGDELISLDGTSADAWIKRLVRWTHGSNPRFKRQIAAMSIVARQQTGGPVQGGFPRAPLETGDSSTIVVRRANGNVETYVVAWEKSGTPTLEFGPVHDSLYSQAPVHTIDPAVGLKAWAAAPGSPLPVFALPAGFHTHLGGVGPNGFPLAPFFTGTFEANGLRIGLLRFPGFGGPPTGIYKDQLAGEIAYLQANTDALVLDVMHNSGGGSEYSDIAISYLIPTPRKSVLAAWRPTQSTLGDLNELAQGLRATDPFAAHFLDQTREKVLQAYRRGDALTDPYPLDPVADLDDQSTWLRPPAMDAQGNVLAYSKPIMLLIDERTISAGDAFASQFQDNHRGLVFGMRSNGAGGNVAAVPIGNYAEGQTGAEINLVVRHQIVKAPGYPATKYLDNVGVQPDLTEDFMTRENLVNGGSTFSQHMVAALVRYVQQSQP